MTFTVLPRRLSKTLTTPRLTVVRVPSQRSSTSQIVPRTVAEAYLPLVLNFPLPLPHSLPSTDFAPRFFFLADTLAARAPFNGAHSEREIWFLRTSSVVSGAGFFGFFFGTACLI